MVSPQNISKIKDTKPVPKIEWNDKSVTAYTDLGLEVPETVCRWERRFLSTVDVTKGPIERSVVSMVRLKAPDYLGQEKNKSKLPERKEFIYFTERWQGRGWNGVPINPVAEHIEGYWIKQFTKPHFNQQTGEIDFNELDVGNTQTIYTIPWSKKNVDDIIGKSVHTDKDTIIFTIKFDGLDNPWGGRAPTRAQFTYDQFANWKWDDVTIHQSRQFRRTMNGWKIKASLNNLAFEPQ